MQSSTNSKIAMVVLACLVAACITMALTSCGTLQDVGRGTVASGATVLKVVDAQVAVKYREAAQAALEASQSLEEYEGRMAPWNAVEEALEGCQASLLALQAVLDAWEAGGQGQFLGVLVRAWEAFQQLSQLLTVAGVELPQELVAFLSAVQQLVAQTVEQ